MNGETQRRESMVRIAADHPTFAGHFPGAPMLPGALLAALVVEALGETPKLAAAPGSSLQIDELKLLAPVLPGAALNIAWWPGRGGVAFEVRDGSTLAARGRMSRIAEP